ncbi:MAG: hypothetical protein WBS54_02210 [Acidobacteriota bacterium]
MESNSPGSKGVTKGRAARHPAARGGVPLDPIEALLSRLIDYAGLFPPAGLTMADAVSNYAAHLRGPHAWMLGRFVVPEARLRELEAAVAALPSAEGAAPWRLSVLVPPPWEEASRRIGSLGLEEDQPLRLLAVEAVDVRVERPEDVAAAREAFPRTPELYVEPPPHASPEPFLAAIAAAGVRAKIRTGGVSLEQIPGAASLAWFMTAARSAGVPFKATAGLHHALRSVRPLTYEPGAPRGLMHGFLNLFLAAALIRSLGAGAEEALRLIEERSPSALHLDSRGVAWSGRRLGSEEIALGRTFALSFGSCSFTEPVADLKEMRWL